MLFCGGNVRREDDLFCCILFGCRAVRDLLSAERRYFVWSYLCEVRSCVGESSEDINESLIRFDSKSKAVVRREVVKDVWVIGCVRWKFVLFRCRNVW